MLLTSCSVSLSIDSVCVSVVSVAFVTLVFCISLVISVKFSRVSKGPRIKYI